MHKQNWLEPLRFDWAGEHGPPFTKEDLEQCVINLIINDDFHPPWDPPVYIRQKPWWDPRNPGGSKNGSDGVYIPGKQKIPRYPQLSTLTKAQHMAGVKVLTATYICQPWEFATPAQDDYSSFEKIKDIYQKEQMEYRLWAKKCWVNGDCIRTLSLKPLLEAVYDAQFQLKKMEFRAMPNEFTMMADMALEPKEDAFEMEHILDLKLVDISTLPIVQIPFELTEDVSIMKPYALTVPCPRHAIKFILPHENKLTTLRQPEINRQLALFALENGANFIASEKALQSLLETQLTWKLPVSVEAVKCPEGGGVKTVVVLGTGFHLQKECGKQRSFEAFRRLLLNAFTSPDASASSTLSSAAHQADTNLEHLFHPTNTFENSNDSKSNAPNDTSSTANSETKPLSELKPRMKSPDASASSTLSSAAHQADTNLEHLFRLSNTFENSYENKSNAPNDTSSTASSETKPLSELKPSMKSPDASASSTLSSAAHQADTNLEHLHLSNTFENSNENKSNALNDASSTASSETKPLFIDDQEFDYSGPAYGVASYEEGGPPPRSFKKWQVKNATTNMNFDLIVHSSHKCFNHVSECEVILEPIVEWQPELGACKQSPGRVRALALALMMRNDAELVNVRVDYKTGNIIVIDTLTEEMWKTWHGDKTAEIAGRIHGAIEQLRLLTPGQYILAHDPCHDAHAMIYKEAAPAGAGFAGYSMSLRPDSEDLSEPEEAALAKSHYSELSRALLPIHKANEILPLAFTYKKKHVKGYTKKTPVVAPAELQEKKRLKTKKKMKEKRRRAKRAAKEKLLNSTS